MDGPLPIPTPINRDRCCHCQRRDGTNQGAVCHPAVVPAPRALLGVTDKILAGDVVMVADLGSAHAGEERFRAVRVDTRQVRIQLAMINPGQIEAVMQIIRKLPPTLSITHNFKLPPRDRNRSHACLWVPKRR